MIDNDRFAEMRARQPFLFHSVRMATDTKIASILEHGLDRDCSNYRGFWESRPEHTYLGVLAYTRRLHEGFPNEAPPVLLRIDTSCLEAGKVSVDEDAFMMHNTGQGKAYDDGINPALRHFHLPFPPTKWLYDTAVHLGIGPLPSLGEWANLVGLGDNPDETWHSFRAGSIAYAGVVPPAAIKVLPAIKPVEVNTPEGE